MIKLIFIMAILGISISYAGTIDPNVPDDKYIEYGDKFHSVVKLSCVNNETILPAGGVNTSWGSAVIIDPHWIITAAHVVEDSYGWSVSFEGKQHEVKKIIIHPEYKTNVFGYNDIALGFLEEEIKLNYYPALYQNSDEVGKICSLAGYGFTGTFDTGIIDFDDKKRAGSNFVDRAERKTLVCSPSKKNKTTELEFLISRGDSGGGLFINNKLAGIHSSVMARDGKSDSSYTDESSHTRISLFCGWIKENMK
jgi:hypothetical protein